MTKKKNRKNILRITISIVVIIMCSVVVQASGKGEIVETIKVGYISNYGAMSSSLLEEKKGYGYEYLYELMKYTKGNYELEFVECQWSESFELLKRGEIDLLGPLSYSEERDNQFIYSGSFGDEELYLTAAEGDELNVIAKLGTEPVYYITNQSNSKLMQDINIAMEHLNDEDHLFEEKLYLKYYEEGLNNSVDITTEEYEQLQSKTYKVGYIKDYAPLSYMTNDDELTGIYIETINYLAEVANLDIEYVEITPGSQVPENVDFWVNTQTEEHLKYSTAYAFFPFVLVEHEKPIRHKAETIGALDYYDFSKTGIDKTDKSIGVKQFEDLEDLVNAYNTQSVTSMVLTTFNLNLVRDQIEEKYIANVLNSGMNMRIAYAEEFSEEKISSINQLLTHISQDEKEYWSIKHSSYHVGDEKSFWVENQETILMIMALFFVTVYIISTIRKRVQLTKLLNYDELTGLCSKRYFQEKVRKILDENDEKEYILFSVDIDNFKYINEMYGYKVGTKVLKIFAELLENQTCSKLPIARLDADQFLVLAERTNAENEITRSKKYRNIMVEQTSCLLGKEYPLRFSVGVYNIQDKEISIDHMIDCANLARKEGKQHVGTSVKYFTEDINLERQINNEVILKMDKALENHDFVLYYQPKIQLDTQKIIGAEALVRWLDNSKLISPNHFIPLFEKNGFIEKLDYYIIEEVCSFLAINNTINIPVISINLSGVTVLKNNVVEVITAILDKYQIQPEQIDLEITESAFVGSFDTAIAKIDSLREAGFTISMDDFGAGISSLNRLKEINLDILKMDRGFIVDALDNPKGRKIIQNVINMSKDLQIETVAEGIETQEQLEFLSKLGCDIGQGYYFSRPLPEDKFLDYIQK